MADGDDSTAAYADRDVYDDEGNRVAVVAEYDQSDGVAYLDPQDDVNPDTWESVAKGDDETWDNTVDYESWQRGETDGDGPPTDGEWPYTVAEDDIEETEDGHLRILT